MIYFYLNIDNAISVPSPFTKGRRANLVPVFHVQLKSKRMLILHTHIH